MGSSPLHSNNRFEPVGYVAAAYWSAVGYFLDRPRTYVVPKLKEIKPKPPRKSYTLKSEVKQPEIQYRSSVRTRRSSLLISNGCEESNDSSYAVDEEENTPPKKKRKYTLEPSFGEIEESEKCGTWVLLGPRMITIDFVVKKVKGVPVCEITLGSKVILETGYILLFVQGRSLLILGSKRKSSIDFRVKKVKGLPICEITLGSKVILELDTYFFLSKEELY
ncbi:hypothetical protein J6590_047723 [Homalodisca vitripennis]|nr:hypothetical protein J6590_047723 [Homalodisca vitripennis]